MQLQGFDYLISLLFVLLFLLIVSIIIFSILFTIFCVSYIYHILTINLILQSIWSEIKILCIFNLVYQLDHLDRKWLRRDSRVQSLMSHNNRRYYISSSQLREKYSSLSSDQKKCKTRVKGRKDRLIYRLYHWTWRTIRIMMQFAYLFGLWMWL